MAYTIIDLVPFFEFSSNDKLIYGPIIGAVVASLLGVVIGAGITYGVNVYEQENKRNKEGIASSSKKLGKEITYLGDIISKLVYVRSDLDTVEYSIKTRIASLKDKAKKEVAIYYDELPQLTLPDLDLGRVGSSEVMSRWRLLDMKVRFFNRDINQFVELYRPLRDISRSNSEPSDSIENSVIKGGESILEEVEAMQHMTMELIAIATLAANYKIGVDVKSVKSSREANNLVMQSYDFKPSEKAINNKVLEYSPIN